MADLPTPLTSGPIRHGAAAHWGAVVLIVLLVAAGIQGGVVWWLHQQLAAALSIRPPVLILDLSAAARAAEPAELPALLRAYTQAAERLAAQGVLVLERHAILATPAAVLVSDQEVRRAAP
ncbi:hypothetical protein [uncultured Thiocystis sp.]|jgi:hypothetical protein|uniref:hypothetical protein n=1 Tax=uncultured Thiocystis sp. TaxID=1202134 RepID=UPI0025D1A950|nr:hypothetical protein [uncultured Thiocystis sp.]